jgi:hypothetical protein
VHPRTRQILGRRLQEPTPENRWIDGHYSGRVPSGEVEEVERSRAISAHRWRLTEVRKAKERAGTDKREEIRPADRERPAVLASPASKYKVEIGVHDKAPARGADKVTAKGRPTILQRLTRH